MPTATPARAAIPVSSLLYLSNDRLMRWDRRTTLAEPLADGVAAFAASADGRSVAYTQLQGMAANGVLRYNLIHLNLVTLTSTAVLTQSPALRMFAISPNGLRLAFVPDVEGRPIYGASLEQRIPQRLGACASDDPTLCDRLAWSPDSSSLAWSDASGAWLAAFDGQPARLAIPSEIQVTDPKGQTTPMQVQFSALEWSPLGRFLLAQVRPPHSSVAWAAVLDTTKGSAASVMDAYAQSADEARLRFLPSGDLLLLRASVPGQQRAPSVSIIRVLPTRPDLLALGRSFELISPDFPMLDSSRKDIPVHTLDWPGYVVKGYLPLGVRIRGADAAPMLFKVEMQYGRLEKLIQLPSGITQVLWAPDGSGGLLIDAAGQASFLTLDKAQVFPLNLALGPAPHDFVWLAPNP
jgi:hypothetical protein